MAEIDTTRRRKKRIRLPLRFGMRTLLIAVAVLSVPLGLFSGEMIRLRHQRAVTTRCAGSGTMIVYDYRFGGNSVGDSSAITQLLRSWLGEDVFAEVSGIRWDYTYRPLDGDTIELAARLPAVREMSFVGPPTYTGRPPMPWEPFPSKEEMQLYLARQATAFGRLASCKQLTHMMLYGGFAADQHLIMLADGGNLRSLEVLCAQNVTDEGVQGISGYNNLETLRIADVPNVTDFGASKLERLTELESLDLSGTAITDVTVQHLAKLVELKTLMLRHCMITDAGLHYLLNMKKLRQLDVSYTEITDVGMGTLRSLKGLHELDLSGTQISDDGLDALVGLSELVTLGLDGTEVTDAGLMKLANNAALRHVHVTVRQRISLDGVRRLKACLPECLFECSSFDAARGTTILDAWE